MNAKLATRIKTLRQRLSLTQAEVAAACGVTHYAVCRWETGKRAPTPPMLRTLAAALRVDVAELTAPAEPEAQPCEATIDGLTGQLRAMREPLVVALAVLMDAREGYTITAPVLHHGAPTLERVDRAIAGLQRVLGE